MWRLFFSSFLSFVRKQIIDALKNAAVHCCWQCASVSDLWENDWVLNKVKDRGGGNVLLNMTNTGVGFFLSLLLYRKEENLILYYRSLASEKTGGGCTRLFRHGKKSTKLFKRDHRGTEHKELEVLQWNNWRRTRCDTVKELVWNCVLKKDRGWSHFPNEVLKSSNRLVSSPAAGSQKHAASTCPSLCPTYQLSLFFKTAAKQIHNCRNVLHFFCCCLLLFCTTIMLFSTTPCHWKPMPSSTSQSKTAVLFFPWCKICCPTILAFNLTISHLAGLSRCLYRRSFCRKIS